MSPEFTKTKSGAAADELFEASYDRYRQALEIKPDMHEALNNWGNALSAQAKAKKAEQAESLWEEAKQKLDQAERIQSGSGAYNLACVDSLTGDESACREHLEFAHRGGTLPARDFVASDEDLVAVRDTEWFEAFLRSISDRQER